MKNLGRKMSVRCKRCLDSVVSGLASLHIAHSCIERPLRAAQASYQPVPQMCGKPRFPAQTHQTSYGMFGALLLRKSH